MSIPSTPHVLPAAGLSRLLKQAPLPQRALGQMLRIKEGAQGLSHMTALQDTLVAWLPKAMVSRSEAELSEGTLLELLETALLYYSVPLMGGRLFKNGLHALAPRAAGLDRALLSKPLDALPAAAQAKAVPVKAAIILASLGTAILGEYILNHAKVLMTAKVYRKERFSDVVNLSDGGPAGEIKQGEGPVVEKSRRRIQQCLLALAGVLGAAALTARFGGRAGFAQKPLEALVRRLDFRFGENGLFSLSRAQMYTYMALAVPSYLDSARDRLEGLEVATRLALVLPYLAFGQGLLEKALTRRIGRRFPEVLDAAGQVRPLRDLSAEALRDAKSIGEASLRFRKPLAGKSLLFGIPLAVGVLGTGLGVGLLNRFWTARRFHRQKRTVPPPVTFSASASPLVRKSFEAFTGVRTVGMPASAPLPRRGYTQIPARPS